MWTWYRAAIASRTEPGQVGLLARGLSALAVLAAVSFPPSQAAEPTGATQYRKNVEPVLDRFCSGCHAGEASKGAVAFDKPVSDLQADSDLWWKTLKVLRAGMMPPKGKARPTAEQVEAIAG